MVCKDYGLCQRTFREFDDLQGWPEKVKTMQRNWIGRSEGVQISFALSEGSFLQASYNPPDTLFGVNYIAVAPQHPLLAEASKQNQELSDFILACNRVKVAEADIAKLEKKGMFTGLMLNTLLLKMLVLYGSQILC